jgi:CheY-like chemotaxis protein
VSESSITVVSKRRVIVVDDEKVLATSLALILNQAGFETHAMFSGEEAIDSLGRIQPDMLITDVILPGMTGIETAIITRSKLPECKILLFSGQAITADLLQMAREQGHDFEFVSKPIHPSDLLDKMRD